MALNPTRVKKIKCRLSMGNEYYPCVFCGVVFSVSDLTIDHIIPKSRNGSNHISNLVLACRQCNEDRNIAEFMQYRMWKVGKLSKIPKGARK